MNQTARQTPLTHRLTGLAEAQPVMLLNGGMMTFATWSPLPERLEDGYQVLCFDFRGQLLSPGDGPADLAGHAADALALLDRVGWPSAHLVGASFGAEVAIELAARAPERVRSLALITAMDRETPEFRAGSDLMREILPATSTSEGRERFWDTMVGGVYSAAYREAEAAALATRRGQLSYIPAAWFAGVDRLLVAMRGFDLTPLLPQIKCPTLAVLAGDDQVMSAERSRALAAALHAEVAVHPTAGHGLVAEDPEWLARVCRDFLDRQATRG
jgi:3-oxoadipate enol-lactonase